MILTKKALDRKDFQRKLEGGVVDLYTLKNDDGMEFYITNFGARIVGGRIPFHGNFIDPILGFDSLDGYLNANEKFHGAAIGRFGNRISQAKFILQGKKYELTKNDGNNSLHGGPEGFHNKVWEVAYHNSTMLVLRLTSPDGEEGFPGNLYTTLTYTIKDQSLKIEFEATTDQPTIINLTHHNYFNLNGEGNGTILDHEIKIDADFYTPVNAESIPTGIIEPVEGSVFDLRNSLKISQALDNQEGNDIITGFDHNFVLNQKASTGISPAARVVGCNGLVLELYTNEPGLQFYTGIYLNGKDIGKSGKPYEQYNAFCLEQQHFPDSPNKPLFPTTILMPGERYNSYAIHKYLY